MYPQKVKGDNCYGTNFLKKIPGLQWRWGPNALANFHFLPSVAAGSWTGAAGTQTVDPTHHGMPVLHVEAQHHSDSPRVQI